MWRWPTKRPRKTNNPIRLQFLIGLFPYIRLKISTQYFILNDGTYEATWKAFFISKLSAIQMEVINSGKSSGIVWLENNPHIYMLFDLYPAIDWNELINFSPQMVLFWIFTTASVIHEWRAKRKQLHECQHKWKANRRSFYLFLSNIMARKRQNENKIKVLHASQK